MQFVPCLANAIARRKAAFIESHFTAAVSRGSKGGWHSAPNTRAKSQVGIKVCRGGLSKCIALRLNSLGRAQCNS